IRAVVMREFVYLLFRGLDLLRSDCRFSEQDKSSSMVRRLFQNLCRFLESLLGLAYPDKDKRELVTTVQIVGRDFLRSHQELSRPQGHPFCGPHCTATSIGDRIRRIELQNREVINLGGVILPRFKVAFSLLQRTGLLHLRAATTAKQYQHRE